MDNFINKFNAFTTEWAEHCQSVAFSSKMSDYLNHPAYRKLVELGPPAIPYIIEQYKEDEHLPWEFVLDELTGFHKIENSSNFSPSEVKKRWLKWWEQTAEICEDLETRRKQTAHMEQSHKHSPAFAHSLIHKSHGRLEVGVQFSAS